MKKQLFAVLAMLGMWLAAVPVIYAQSKPVVTVSLSGYDNLIADFDYMASLVGNGAVNSQQLEGMLKLFTGGKGADLLDRKAPWGLVVMTNGSDFTPYGFLPITDTDGFMTVVGNMAAGVKDEEDGVKSVKFKNGPRLFMKPQTGFVYFAPEAEMLKDVAADPVSLLGKLPKEYDVAVQVNVQNVPEMYREMAIGQLRQGMEQGLRQSPGEDDAAFEVRKKVVESQLAQFETAIKDIDTIGLGLNIDSGIKAVNLDFTGTVKPGSQISTNVSTTSAFAGMLQANAGMTGNITNKLDARSIESLVTLLKSLSDTAKRELDKDDSLSDDNRTVAKEIVAEAIDIAMQTIQTGKLDAAGTLAFGEKSMTAYAGLGVHDGKAVEKLVKRIVEVTRNDLADVKLDMGEHNGVKLHQVGIPVPDDKAREIFGDNLTATVGIGEKAVYIGLGKEGLQQLKSAIDASAATPNAKLDPLSLNMAMTPMMQFAGSMDNNPGIEMVNQTLAAAGGKDHVIITSTEIPNGSLTRIQIEEGVLRLIGVAAQVGMRRGAPKFEDGL